LVNTRKKQTTQLTTHHFIPGITLPRLYLISSTAIPILAHHQYPPKMPTDDLKSYATSTTDFYALLSLPHNPSQKELDRAWRRTALKYHPDKVGAADAAARENFHLAQIGYDVLSDPAVRALYDNARAAREQKARLNAQLEGRRRAMKEELEGRERGVKRGRDEGPGAGAGAQDAFERELARLAEDGKRRRREREEALRQEIVRERQEAEQQQQQQQQEQEKQQQEKNGAGAAGGTEAQGPVAEMDRTVKVRFARSGPGAHVDKERLAELFGAFGRVENAFLLKDKRGRVGGATGPKQLVATGVVVFASVVGAHAAVEDAPTMTAAPEWPLLRNVFWAANKEPDFFAAAAAESHNAATAAASPTPATPRKGNGSTAAFALPTWPSPSQPETPAEGLRKVPSFASFSSAAGSPGAAGSPSLEEFTMVRLRMAEKRRLEAEIRREEEGVDGADGGKGL
jgi:DnaJ family protein C protein 17